MTKYNRDKFQLHRFQDKQRTLVLVRNRTATNPIEETFVSSSKARENCSTMQHRRMVDKLGNIKGIFPGEHLDNEEQFKDARVAVQKSFMTATKPNMYESWITEENEIG